MRGSDSCEAESRRRADKTVTIPGSDAHSVVADLAASTLLVTQLPEPSSCPLHPSLGSVDQRHVGEWRS
jgi:hypothetical protein